MRLDVGQHMRLGQQMKLAPRMIQSMEILQMPMAALEERIEQELASNPTLELQEGVNDDRAAADLAQQDRDDREQQRELIVSDNANDSAADFERLSNLADQYGSDWADNTSEAGDYADRPRRLQDTGERDAKLDAMANTATRTASLFEQLMDQWRLAEVPPEQLDLGEYLIGQIDADGYLRATDADLLAQAPPNTTLSLLQDTVQQLQRWLEPPGLAARDLRQCLLLQIDHKIDNDPDAHADQLDLQRRLVDHHLKDLEANRLPKITKDLGTDLDTLKLAILALRQFHPHPGKLLADDGIRTITPDAIVDYDDHTDTYTATLTHSRVPALQIAPGYEDLAKSKEQDKETKEFLGNHLRNARFLLDAIAQRNNTLLRVIGVVVQAQRDYFEQGNAALRPLPMTLVADQLGIHVATVSRAVSEKYLQTTRGIVPLRMFFSGGTQTDEGEAMSWTAVQAKLKDIIDAEDKNNPLSDDELVDAIKKQGIDIARRTIAKYRGQLNIPTARQRRLY